MFKEEMVSKNEQSTEQNLHDETDMRDVLDIKVSK